MKIFNKRPRDSSRFNHLIHTSRSIFIRFSPCDPWWWCFVHGMRWRGERISLIMFHEKSSIHKMLVPSGACFACSFAYFSLFSLHRLTKSRIRRQGFENFMHCDATTTLRLSVVRSLECESRRDVPKIQHSSHSDDDNRLWWDMRERERETRDAFKKTSS